MRPLATLRQSKSTPPQLSTSTLVRPRLTERLGLLARPHEGPRVMVLSAPAGFGKTTVLTDWAPSVPAAGRPLAWCNFDPTDNGCAPFWTTMLSALSVPATPHRDGLAGVSPPRRPADTGFLGTVLDHLAGSATVIVLENVHELDDVGVLGDLDYFVDHLPTDVSIVLSTRSDPPLDALQRARLAGEFDQFRAADLAFSTREVDEVCAGLTPDQSRAIWDWTEGWPALVRLMEMMLRTTDEVAFELGVQDGELADYLFQEAFRRQDAEAQGVLMLASVPESVTVDLAVTLTGHSNAGRLLEVVAQQTGLITRSAADDSARAWYRFHPMLRAYLTGELRRRDRDAERTAHRVAARWLLSEGLDLEALLHAVATGETDFQDEIARLTGPGLVNAGEAPLLLKALGPPARHRRPQSAWVTLVRAAGLLDGGNLHEAVAVLHEVAASRPDLAASSAPEDRDDLATLWRVNELHAHRRRGVWLDTVELSAPWNVKDPDLDLLVVAQRSAALARQGGVDAAEALLGPAIDVARGGRREAALIDCLGVLAAVHSARSDFARMVATADEAIEVAATHGWANTGRVAHPYVLRAWGAYQELDDALARRYARRAAAVVEATADPTVRLSVAALEAGLTDADDPTQRRTADRLHDVSTAFEGVVVSPELVVHVALAEARATLQARRPQGVPEILELLEAQLGRCGEAQVIRAMAEEAAGHRTDARALLSDVTSGRLPVVAPLSRVDAVALSAALAWRADDRYAAFQHAREAIEAAAELGGLRPLVDAGESFQRLLDAGRGRWGTYGSLVDRLLDRTVPAGLPSTLLTAREMEVLRELPNLSTVEEIASSLFVSANTLKTHLRSIYRKLEAPSRRRAVEEARRLGLL